MSDTESPSSFPSAMPTSAPTHGNSSNSIVLLIFFSNLIGIYFLLLIYFIFGNLYYITELKKKVLDSTAEEYDFVEAKDVTLKITVESQRAVLSAATDIDTEGQNVYSTFASS